MAPGRDLGGAAIAAQWSMPLYQLAAEQTINTVFAFFFHKGENPPWNYLLAKTGSFVGLCTNEVV